MDLGFIEINMLEEIVFSAVAIVASLTAFAKKVIQDHFTIAKDQWIYPIFLNILTALFSFGMVLVSWIFIDNSFKGILLMSIIVFLTSVGGYESIVNMLRGISKKKIL